MVEQINRVRNETQWSYRRLCDVTAVPYSSLMRWKYRIRRAEAAVHCPGPKKMGVIDHKELHNRVRDLKHRQKLTLGSGRLFQEYRHGVSRRQFYWIVSKMRAEAKREKRAQMRRVEWHVPGLAWGMDDTGRRKLPVKSKISVNQLRDLCSRKGLSAKVTERLLPEGKVAEKLEEQFDRHGPPLFFKRDNGSNLNGGAVNAVCDRYGVIVLNSPPYYPQYNGLLEWSQRELKEHMAWLLQDINADLSAIQLAADYSLAGLNRWPRPCLQGKSANHVFETRQLAMKTYSTEKRKETREEIMNLAMSIMVGMDPNDRQAEQKAWRIAVETWLRRNGLITVSVGGTVLPCFKSFLVS